MAKESKKEEVLLDSLVGGIAQQIGKMTDDKKKLEKAIDALKDEYVRIATEQGMMDKRGVFDGGTVEVVITPPVPYYKAAMLDEFVPEELLKKCTCMKDATVSVRVKLKEISVPEVK